MFKSNWWKNYIKEINKFRALYNLKKGTELPGYIDYAYWKKLYAITKHDYSFEYSVFLTDLLLNEISSGHAGYIFSSLDKDGVGFSVSANGCMNNEIYFYDSCNVKVPVKKLFDFIIKYDKEDYLYHLNELTYKEN